MRALPLLVATTLAVVACAELRDILTLQQGLAKEFNEPAIGININNTSMTITFANVSADTLPEKDRAAYARRAAEYVRDHYTHYSSLQSVDVRFASVTKTGPVTYTQSSTPYHFTPADLGPPKVSAEKTVSS